VPLANGNPLHVQEIALQWLEKGSVREAPGSLKAMIEARIQALPTSAKRALDASTIAGPHATPRLLSLALDEPPVNVLDALDRLEHDGLIVFDGVSYSIRHDVIEATVSHRIAPGAAALLHHRIACAVGTIATNDSSPSLYWQCYQHWHAAGMQLAATRALLSFSHHLLMAGRTDECDQLLTSYFQSGIDEASKALVSRQLLVSGIRLGRWSQVEGVITFLSTTQHDVIDHVLHLFQARWRSNSDVTALCEEALALASRCGVPPQLRIRAATWALIFADNAGRADCSTTTDRFVGPLLTLLPANDPYSLHYQLLSACDQRRLDDLELVAVRLADAASQIGEVAERTRLLRHASHGLQIAGAIEASQGVLLTAIDICARSGARWSLALCQETMAQLYLRLHDTVSAREWTRRAADSFSHAEDEHGRASIAILLFQICVADGDLIAARKHLDEIGPPESEDSNASRQMCRAIARLRLAPFIGTPREELVNSISQSEHIVRSISAGHVADFAASAVIHARWAIGDRNGAERFFDEYLTSIRGYRGPLHIDLENARRLLRASTICALDASLLSS
jgi:hypothetical protein